MDATSGSIVRAGKMIHRDIAVRLAKRTPDSHGFATLNTNTDAIGLVVTEKSMNCSIWFGDGSYTPIEFTGSSGSHAFFKVL